MSKIKEAAEPHDPRLTNKERRRGRRKNEKKQETVESPVAVGMFPVNDKLTVVDVAFPASVRHLMPPREAIGGYPRKRELESLVSRLFFDGGVLKTKPREGVDEAKAITHLRCILGSYEPKHEHKIEAVAWLINEWFEEFTVEQAETSK